MQNKKRGLKTLKNSAASFIDAEFVEKASLWILRILFQLDGFNKFIDRDGYLQSNDILLFLGGDKYLDDGKEALETRNDIIANFTHRLTVLDKKSLKSTKNTTLAKNIQKITTLIQLNKVERQIIEFLFLVKQHKILEDAMEFLGSDLTTKQVKRVLSIVLDIDYVKVDEAFKSNAKLVQSSLLSINKQTTNFFERKFDSINDTFIDNMTNANEKISTMLQDVLRPCKESDLKLGDYRHLKKDISIMLSYLQKSLKKKQKGVNILLYGAAGTGKTELTKVLAKELKLDLYEVSYADEEGNAMDGQARTKAYKVAQALLAHQNTFLMYDEAEDIFESSGGGFFAPVSRQRDKAWINRMLENNSVATVWITNNIHSIDQAIARRFDYTLEVPVPKKSQRQKIIQKYSQGILDDKTVKLLATHPTIAPAVIAQATKVIKNIGYQKGSKEFLRIVNNTIKAQGLEPIKTPKK